jgi:predicted nucleotidyltransferase
MFKISKIKNYLAENPDIVAAYLFGSAVSGERVVNDLDILVLLDQKANRLNIQLELVSNLSRLTGLKADKIDVVIFDQEEVDPDILQTAINHGMLLKNIDQRVLSDRIGDLSQYYLKNEPMILRAKRLEKERLEAFCGG